MMKREGDIFYCFKNETRVRFLVGYDIEPIHFWCKRHYSMMIDHTGVSMPNRDSYDSFFGMGKPLRLLLSMANVPYKI